MGRTIAVIRGLAAGEEAAVSVEYAFLLVVAATACLGLQLLGAALPGLYARATNALP